MADSCAGEPVGENLDACFPLVNEGADAEASALSKSYTASQENLRPRLIAGVQGRWAGASRSRVIPHTTTAWSHINIKRTHEQSRMLFWQLGDVARYATSLILGQHIGHMGVTLVLA